jgi:outer membrane protein assembly factor BamB
MKMRSSFFSAVGLSLFCLGAGAADWPQWRGPHRDGISPETGLLKGWPKDGPKLLWQLREIGAGYSTPAVVADRLYVQTNKGVADEFVQAFQVKDGTHIWSTRLGKVGPNQGPQYPGARGTPTVDGDLLYALGSDGDLVCLETATGKPRWHKNLRAEFGGKPGQWAYAESPLIDGDHLICTPGGTDATLVALTKTTGAVVWKCPVPGGDKADYASCISVAAPGGKEYVQFVSKGLVGVDAQTGKFLWRYDQTAKGSPAHIATPIAHDAFVYNATRKGGAALLHIEDKGGTITAKQVYFQKDLPSAIGGAVLVGGHLYGTNARGLVCAEFATGKVKWTDPCVGPASVCYADGRLYVHGDNNDEVVLVAASPAAYQEHGRFTLPAQPERGKTKAWAYPVIANGRLYLRDQGALWSYDIKAAK